MENMTATVETAKMTEAEEMAAEEAGIEEAQAVKFATGVAVSKTKVARIPNPVIKPLAPTAISIQDPNKPQKAQTAPPL